jgi:hypothetical protein
MKYTPIVVIFYILFFSLYLINIVNSSNDIGENYSEYIDKLTVVNLPHTSDTLDIRQNQTVQPATTITHEMLTWEMIRLSWGILAFGFAAVLLIMIMVLKVNKGWDKELTRLFTVVMVIIAGLFLMTAGYDDKQVAPMFGLLGTLLGYIFGKSSSTDDSNKPGP